MVYTPNVKSVSFSVYGESKMQQMRTFADLLTFYMERTGIGDAELARRIPVSRPTLIRWREGVTARPRYREDVVRCAEILRLTPSETDEFLLAAGYSPETAAATPQSSPVAEVEEDAPETAAAPPQSSPVEGGDAERVSSHIAGEEESKWFKRRGVPAGVALGVLAIAAIAVALWLVLRDDTEYPAAADGESLIVLSPFVNYTGGQQGYNVLGRLKDEIDNEVRAAGLSDVRAVEWPNQITSESDAEDAGRRSSAVVVIWGEYDSGRAIARFTTPRTRSAQLDRQVVDIASSPSELSSTINAEFTEQARYMALLTLGQLYLDRGEFDLAKTALLHAADKNPTDPATLANLRFQLGRAYLGGDFADYDEAVWLFTQVLAARPKSVEALNSRAVAYLERGRAGDVERAIDDLVQALTIEPERAATYVNLAAAYAERGAGADLDRAILELTEALRIEAGYASAYVNRAGAYVARGAPGDVERAFDDLDAALDGEPDLSAAYLTRGKRLHRPKLAGRRGLGGCGVWPRHRTGARFSDGLLQPRAGLFGVGELARVRVRPAAGATAQSKRRGVHADALLAAIGIRQPGRCAAPMRKGRRAKPIGTSEGRQGACPRSDGKRRDGDSGLRGVSSVG